MEDEIEKLLETLGISEKVIQASFVLSFSQLIKVLSMLRGRRNRSRNSQRRRLLSLALMQMSKAAKQCTLEAVDVIQIGLDAFSREDLCMNG